MSRQFAHDLTRAVIAQICQNLGFTAIQASALETLSDVLEKYIQEIGRTTHELSELAGRTESNFIDLKASLIEMGTTLEEIQTFALNTDEMPFAKRKGMSCCTVGVRKSVTKSTRPATPAFPAKKPPQKPKKPLDVVGEHKAEMEKERQDRENEKKSLENEETKETEENGETAKNENEENEIEKEKSKDTDTGKPKSRIRRQEVPDYFPPFPPEHTFVKTAVYNSRATDKKTIRKLKNKHRRQVETSLTSLRGPNATSHLTNYDVAAAAAAEVPGLAADGGNAFASEGVKTCDRASKPVTLGLKKQKVPQGINPFLPAVVLERLAADDNVQGQNELDPEKVENPYLTVKKPSEASVTKFAPFALANGTKRQKT